MKIVKELVLVFLVGLGIHRIVQDVMSWIDPELVASKGTGYFSVIVFVALYFTVRYFKERDKKLQAKKADAVN